MMSAAAMCRRIYRGLRSILAAGIVTFGRLVCRNAGCSNILFVVKVHFFRYRSIILFLHFIDSFQTLSVIHKPGDAGIPPISVMVIPSVVSVTFRKMAYTVLNQIHGSFAEFRRLFPGFGKSLYAGRAVLTDSVIRAAVAFRNSLPLIGQFVDPGPRRFKAFLQRMSLDHIQAAAGHQVPLPVQRKAGTSGSASDPAL